MTGHPEDKVQAVIPASDFGTQLKLERQIFWVKKNGVVMFEAGITQCSFSSSFGEMDPNLGFI